MIRVGLGVDFHRLAPGRPLWLGGVRIPADVGLLGHSDADVLCHAVIDAVLGAAGLGDIGEHFPPEDPAWAGADSLDLLRRTVALAGSAGFRVRQVDATLVAEAPRVSPHRAAMVAALAAALGVAVGDVSVKATTPEGLGALGRREGMAAVAVAVCERVDSGAPASLD